MAMKKRAAVRGDTNSAVLSARVYDAGTEVEVSSSDLQQRAEPITSPYAADIVFVTAGVDVQSSRLEVTYLAHHLDGSATVLNHLELMGDTSGNAVWESLDAALGAVFPLADGRKLGIRATAVDCGFAIDQVLNFVGLQRRKSRATYPVKAYGGFDRMPLARGGKIKGKICHLAVGVDRVKQETQKRLASQPTEPGYIRLPNHLLPEYFDGLASEKLVSRAVRGVSRYEYHRIYRENDPFDCLVYAIAIAKAVDMKTINKPRASTFDPRVIPAMAAELNRSG